jgi:hypothetical protein
MEIKDEETWNKLLSNAYPVSDVHMYGYYQSWNHHSNPRRHLWFDGHYIWSYYIDNGVAIGLKNQRLPPLKVTYTDKSPNFKEIDADSLYWISCELDEDMSNVDKKERNPRTIVQVIKPNKYLDSLRKSTRYEIRKALKRKYYKEYIGDPVEYAEEIARINSTANYMPEHSKSVEQEIKKFSVMRDCWKDRGKMIGIFKNDVMYAYMFITLGNDIASFSSYFVSNESKSDGVGNLLHYGGYKVAYENGIDYVMSAYAPRRESIQTFHYNMGFELCKQYVNEVTL